VLNHTWVKHDAPKTLLLTASNLFRNDSARDVHQMQEHFNVINRLTAAASRLEVVTSEPECSSSSSNVSSNDNSPLVSPQILQTTANTSTANDLLMGVVVEEETVVDEEEKNNDNNDDDDDEEEEGGLEMNVPAPAPMPFDTEEEISQKLEGTAIHSSDVEQMPKPMFYQQQPQEYSPQPFAAQAPMMSYQSGGGATAYQPAPQHMISSNGMLYCAPPPMCSYPVMMMNNQQHMAPPMYFPPNPQQQQYVQQSSQQSVHYYPSPFYYYVMPPTDMVNA